MQNAEGLITVYDGDDLMAIVPLAEIKTVVFADCGDWQRIQSIIEEISNVKPKAE